MSFFSALLPNYYYYYYYYYCYYLVVVVLVLPVEVTSTHSFFNVDRITAIGFPLGRPLQ